MPRKPFARALITGASSGIGAEMARQLADKGSALVLVARREEAMKEIAEAVDVEVEILPADLTVYADVQRVADRIGADPEIDLVVNNAGFGNAGTFRELDVAWERSQVDIHVRAVVTLSHAALATMTPRGRGGLLNVSSVTSFQPVPGGATYAACKAFMTSFTEALHVEQLGTGVHVSTLCPGFTDTELIAKTEGLKVPGPLLMTVEDVARAGLDAVAENDAVRVPGLAYKAAAALADSLPRDVMRTVMRVSSSLMGDMTSR